MTEKKNIFPFIFFLLREQKWREKNQCKRQLISHYNQSYIGMSELSSEETVVAELLGTGDDSSGLGDTTGMSELNSSSPMECISQVLYEPKK